MKKIMVFAITITMLLCMSLTAFAAPSSSEIDVKAKFTYVTDDTTYTAPTSEGEATVTTSDGITITITGDIPDRLILVVKHVTPNEEEAYRWFCKVLEGKVTKICPFDIFFLKNGERIELSTAMKITITMPNGYTSPQMYSVDSTGKTTLLDTTVFDGEISFITDRNSFYVLGNKVSDSGGNPETGDDKSIFACSILIISSLGFVFTLSRKRKAVK